MNDSDILAGTLAFHGHKCWASTAGVRLGLAAMDALGASRAGAKQLHAIIETGDYHGGMCFGDGIQFTTGCTFGKGNIEKSGEGKFAVTLIDKATKRAVRVAYKPTLQPAIKASAFMQKRSAGVPPTEIPEADQMELVDLVWNAPEADILTVGPVFQYDKNWLPEVMGFTKCESCGELVAHAYVRLVGDRKVCIPCSGYDR